MNPRKISIILSFIIAGAAVISYLFIRSGDNNSVFDSSSRPALLNNTIGLAAAVAHDGSTASQPTSNRAAANPDPISICTPGIVHKHEVLLSGRIVDSKGTPVAGAKIQYCIDGEPSGITDTLGKFFVTGTRWDFKDGAGLDVSAAGYCHSYYSGIPRITNSTDVGDVILYKTSTTTIRVLDGSGAPVSNAIVTFRAGDLSPSMFRYNEGYISGGASFSGPPRIRASKTTNTSGETTFRNLSAGDVDAVISKSGYATTLTQLTITPETDRQFEINIPTESPIVGIIVDETGTPIHRGHIELLTFGVYNTDDITHNSLYAGDDGHFEIHGFSARDRVKLRFDAFGHLCRTMDAPAIRESKIVVLPHAPMVRLQLMLAGGSGSTDAEFPFGGIDDHDVSIWLLPVPDDGSPMTDVPWGRYKTIDNNFVDVAVESLQSLPGDEWIESGATAKHKKWRAVVSYFEGYGASAPFDIPRAGATPPLIPVFRDSPGATLRVGINDMNGKPTMDALVTLQSIDINNFETPARPDAGSNNYIFKNLNRGTYKLSAKSPTIHFEPATVTITRVDEDVHVELHARPLARIHGTLMIGGAAPGRMIAIRICHKDVDWTTDGVAATDNEGKFSFGPVQPGRIHLFAGVNKPPRSSYYSFADLAPKPDENTIAGNATANIAAEADVEVNITLP
ncbi:MAG: carboxypeptidase regulatory-like domain-containing protein [Planctomycetes bacterium]|nr:carboxypeptidase regulatory-like domain-containing protein [Planctomycetota bacterium]